MRKKFTRSNNKTCSSERGREEFRPVFQFSFIDYTTHTSPVRFPLQPNLVFDQTLFFSFFFFLQDFMPVGNSLLNAPLRLGGHRSSAQCQHYAASTWVTVDVWLSWDLTVILNVSNRSVQYVGWLHFAVSVCLGNGWHAIGTEWVCWRLVLTQPRSTSLLYK